MHQATIINLKSFREFVLHSDRDTSFDINKLNKALKGYKKTSIGADMWFFSEIDKLPNVAKGPIADTIQSSIEQIAWPHQHLLSLNPLLGKPTGGHRTICITPAFYRIYNRSSDKVTDWEAANDRPYDKAGKGSSALHAALIRNLLAETFANVDEEVIGAFNDFANLLIP